MLLLINACILSCINVLAINNCVPFFAKSISKVIFQQPVTLVVCAFNSPELVAPNYFISKVKLQPSTTQLYSIQTEFEQIAFHLLSSFCNKLKPPP